jgi:hypothetical protein
MKHRVARTFLSTALVVLGASSASAQLPVTPRALGAGGAYLGIARGQEALFLNPANLALSGNPRWSMNFAQLGMSGVTLGPTFEDFAELMMDEGNDDGSRSRQILDHVPASGMELDLELRVPALTLQAGPVAFGVAFGGVHQKLAIIALRGGYTTNLDSQSMLTGGLSLGMLDIGVGKLTGTRDGFDRNG